MGAVQVALVRRWRLGHAKNGCSASDDTHYKTLHGQFENMGSFATSATTEPDADIFDDEEEEGKR